MKTYSSPLRALKVRKLRISLFFPNKREESIANAEGELLDDSGNTQALLYSKMYNKYALDFNNKQIIVGQFKDNWK